LYVISPFFTLRHPNLYPKSISKSLTIVTILQLLLFTALYSPGPGPVPFAYSAEVFPVTHRSIGMSFSVSTISVFASLLSITFPMLLGALGPSGAFAVYSVGNVGAWGTTWLFVPEVKGLRLEEIDGVFEEEVGVRVGRQVREVRGMFGGREKGEDRDVRYQRVGEDEVEE